MAQHPYAKTLKPFPIGHKTGHFYSLPVLGRQLGVDVSRLPVSLRIVLESVLRNCDNQKITPKHVERLAKWKPRATRTAEVPFTVSRVVLQDLTGVPLLADLAAMRNVAQRLGKDPARIEPLVPVDLVVDHSIMIDHQGSKESLDLNMRLEFRRNQERYKFMKWGMQAFSTFHVVPPGFGIVHQVNLEYLARGVYQKEGCYYPDSLVGTDSHTTMINGIGVVGWGVGGIEAESAMLGQPIYLLTPDVVGVELKGRLRPGCTATDLVLTVTELLRKHKVVGKFVEFYGDGTRTLSVPDRATIANMAPEYGATMGFFPVDEATVDYLEKTGRTKEEVTAFTNYFKAQKLFGIPKAGSIDYTSTLALDLSTIVPSLAGPRRPQDRIEIGNVKQNFSSLFSLPPSENGFNQAPDKLNQSYTTSDGIPIKSGDVLIAAITSCTNTSNPGVMLAAGLLAKKAAAKGLKVPVHVKTSLAPGSRVVTSYLEKSGLLPALEELGFAVAAYGCTTCIGNAGDLRPSFNQTITHNDLVCAAVLSGNRNFEARIHPNLKANFLASPPLVVAYALAGTVLRDLMTEPVGQGRNGKDVYLGDIWPQPEEINRVMRHAMNPKVFQSNYEKVASDPGALWKKIESSHGQVYSWPSSTYIAEPPYFEGFSLTLPTPPSGIKGGRILALFGDSVTTDHISPAGSIKDTAPAGQFLLAKQVSKMDFNSYGARRGNHEIMMRGTFANVRIKNLMIPPEANNSRVEGGYTLYQPEGTRTTIFDAAMKYQAANIPSIIFGGEEYGTGSSRDWAAKGPQLLGVKAVVVRSFERIHRSNLVGMGILPLQFQGNDSWQSLNISGNELIDIEWSRKLKPLQKINMIISRANGAREQVSLVLRIDTPIEVEYYQQGGILPFVLRQQLAA